MCGIVGVVRPGVGRDWLQGTTRAMSDALFHRGPDADGVWVDAEASIGLGHRRLSILDLSALGVQPMHSTSGRYVITYNGEVYNFVELTRELARHGYQFRGGSDTEVMLAAFDAWGIEAAVRRFVGMFAFAVWDTEQRVLTLVRDRLGVKPLYWARSGGLFLFGSELKALLACAEWRPEVDRDALAAYARWNYVPSPLCILCGAQKLEPGCILTLRSGADPQITRYWSARAVAAEGVRDRIELSDAEAEQQLDALLRDSVARRMIADVPLGAFLSGGIDSSTVVALMQAQSSRRVRTYSIGFADGDYNEAPHAKRVAAHIGTDHTELYVGPSEALAIIPDLSKYYDEPFADSSQINMVLVSAMTRKHVTVALSGDGGDELFAGYTRYHWAEMVRRFQVVPFGLRRAAAGMIDLPSRSVMEGVARLLPGRWRPQRVAERAGKFAGFLRERDADGIYRRQHSHWHGPEALVRGGREPRGPAYDTSLTADVPSFVERMQLLDTMTYLPDDILTKVDRASMAVSLEAREPLLDHRLVEFSWRLPFRMKVRDGVDKWLLRNVLYRYVPRSLVERPKMGFGLPIGRWLRGPLRDWAEALLAEERLRAAGYFDERHVRTAWSNFLSGRDANQEALWGVLMFEAWRDRFGARVAAAA